MAKKKGLITGIVVGVDANMHDYLIAFRIDGIGEVDALMDDNFSDEIDELAQDEQIDWAKSKIGKHLFCEELVARGYSTKGKTYIV